MVSLCLRTHTCMHACMHACMYVCMYAHIYIYIYTHTHIHTIRAVLSRFLVVVVGKITYDEGKAECRIKHPKPSADSSNASGLWSVRTVRCERLVRLASVTRSPCCALWLHSKNVGCHAVMNRLLLHRGQGKVRFALCGNGYGKDLNPKVRANYEPLSTHIKIAITACRHSEANKIQQDLRNPQTL